MYMTNDEWTNETCDLSWILAEDEEDDEDEDEDDEDEGESLLTVVPIRNF